MKRIILLTVAFLMTFSSQSQLNAQQLVLWHADGTTTEIDLYIKPRVLLTKDKTIVSSPVLNIEYPAEEIIKFTYKGVGLGVKSPYSDTIYEQKDGKIILHGVKSTDRIAIYRPNGVRVPVQAQFSNGNAIFPLSSIPSGVYLLNVNGRTSKVTKK